MTCAFVGRSVDGGCQVLEVRESQEHCDRFVRDLAGPAMAQLPVGRPSRRRRPSSSRAG